MKQALLSILTIIFLVCTFTGCQSSCADVNDPNVLQVQLVGTDNFPEQMVGTWENQDYGWTFKFEPDGKLLKITHTIGRQDICAGRTAIIPLKQQGTANFEPGPWVVHYDASANELVVEIALRSFNYLIADKRIYGSSNDIFTGSLPKAGESIWRAKWMSFPEFFFYLPGTSYKDYRLPVEEAEPDDRGEIVFEKLEPKASNKN